MAHRRPAGSRGQWRPANAVVAVTPGNPGGRPFPARDPEPAMARHLNPAAVMVAGPAEGLIGIPGPALVGPGPATVDIRAPVGAVGQAGPEGIAVAVDLNPFAMRSQRIIKQRVIVVGRRPGLLGRGWSRGGDVGQGPGKLRAFQLLGKAEAFLACRLRIRREAFVFLTDGLEARLELRCLLFLEGFLEVGELLLQVIAALLEFGRLAGIVHLGLFQEPAGFLGDGVRCGLAGGQNGEGKQQAQRKADVFHGSKGAEIQTSPGFYCSAEIEHLHKTRAAMCFSTWG